MSGCRPWSDHQGSTEELGAAGDALRRPFTTLSSSPSRPRRHSSLRRPPRPPHHADLGHLSLQLGSRHVLEVVVIAALPAPGVRLHDEVLHVQRSTRDPRRVRCLSDRRAELGRSVVPAGLLGQTGGGLRGGGTHTSFYNVLCHCCKYNK